MKILCTLGFHSYGPWGPTILTSSYEDGESKFSIRYCRHCNYDHKRWEHLSGWNYNEYGTQVKYKKWKESE